MISAKSAIKTVRITKNGAVTIPAQCRHSLNLKVGQELILQVENGALVLMTQKQAIRRAQDLVRKAIPHDVSLVKQLIAERRDEIRRS